MKLNIITGKAGTGKSTYIFKKIKKIINNKEKIYVITPEQFSFTAEKKLLDEIDTGAVINCEILTFSRMAYRVINEIGNNLQNIEGFGKSMLIYNILDNSKKDLKILGKNIQNIEVLERSITELKKHNITPDKLKDVLGKTDDEYLKSKLEDINFIYDKFQNYIDEKFLDENDSLTYLSENIKNTSIFNNSIIFIDEFAGFTPQEYKVIEELLKVAKEINMTICTDKIDENNLQDNSDIFYTNKITVNKLMEIANKNNIEIPKIIYLDKKYRFKSEELNYLEENIYSNIYKKYEKKPENIKLFLAKNPYSEIEYIANEIIKNVRENRI